MNNYESNYIFTICDVILTISCTYLGIIAELLAVSKNRSICLAVNAQNDMELNSRLESLKASDLEAFLDASLAALRLIQNILQHPLNERYRRLRGTAPILKHKGVTDILEAAGFRLEDAQLVLPEMLLRSVNIEQHLTSCKYDIMAARRATGRKMGWEVPQNCIRVTAMSGISSYGELYDGMMDDKKVTIKMLQQMEVENLRDQFSGEIEILTQLKHPNVVELMGLVITAEPPSMILENLSESMLEVLHRDGLRKERIWGYLNQVVQGMEYIHSNGIIHCSLAARNMFLDAYDTVKIGDFSQSKKVSQLQSVEDIHNPFNVRWMAPEVLQENKWSKEADVWSFGIVMYEFLTSGSVPYADLNNEQVCSKVVGGYRLPRPQTCPAEFHQLMEQCCLRSVHDRPSFQKLHSDHMPVLLEVLKRAPSTSGNSQSSAAKSTIVDQKGGG
jgi:serine/threonine protein kinase